LVFLKPSWAFECIRTQALPVFEMHAHPFVSWEKLYSLDNSLLVQELPSKNCKDQMVLATEQQVHDLTSSPPKPSDRKTKRVFRPYDGEKDSQEREASVPLFSPTKVSKMFLLSQTNDISLVDLPA
jgi:hypothetical protein